MIWRLTYCNKKGVEARIDIVKGNRTPVEVVQGSGQPFTLVYKLDKNDKSGHIMTSSADIEIFETETFNIDDLKTSNETELKVEYFEDDILTWSGFILPDFFSREIGSPNIVRMTASDRLTALKGLTLSDLPSKVSLRDLIELSLAQTGLSLGLVSQIQINQGSTNILDSEVLSQRLTDVRGRSISCYDILMSIMVGTNSTIRQRAGQWQVYNKLEHELRTPTIFFDKVERGAIRTIQPVASSVGVYQEHGGGRIHPENYDFSDNLAGWNPVGGFNGSINNKEILGYYQTYNIIYGEETDKSYLVNSNNFTTSRYIETDAFAVPYEEGKIIVKAEINATGPRVQRGLGAAKIRFALIAEKNGALLSLNDSGAFVAGEHIQEREFSTGSPLDLIAVTMNIEVSGVLMSPAGYSVRLRFYGSNVGVDGDVTRVTAIDSAIVSFDPEAGTPKGNIYKTTQGSNFTKLHDVETTVFGDYITTGLNGYFYKYPIDDTSNLYLPSGELSPPQWITAFDLTERPLLHHISRQKSSLFSVAHDILKANINVESFDPLAVFQDCKGGKYVVVSANFDFLRSEVNVELEQIAYDNTILKRDYIYSYFGDGEDTIKSIGGIAGGGGGGGGTGGSGGMTSDQIAILNDVAKLAHLHENKDVIDQITQDMVDNASHEIVISTDTETELTDENILSALRVLGEITKNNETFLEDLKEQFLSKINPDTAQKLITFIEGVEVGAFTTGALGGGAAIKMIDGTSYAEVDNLTVRQKATFRELIIESLKHIGGQLVLTPARMKCVRVVDGGSFYKCYFDTGDGEVSNEFVEGDLARCQVFTGNGTKFYWRLVTLVGEDWINLSKTSAAAGSDVPEAGDDIAQLGNATDTTRQSAIILSTVGIDAPSWKQYSGINSFSLEGKETTVFTRLGNRIQGKTVFTSGGADLDDYLDGVAQDILDALQAAQDAEDKAQQAIEDAEADVATINEEIGRLQDQIDGKVSNWYYAYSPTLANYPASDWTTDEIKDAHIGDTFTNTEPAPAENAGKSWRFIKDGSTYSWIVISDSDALKALLEASKAQATADGKSTTYLFQPTKYKLGDMWVLNDDHTINGTVYKQGDLLTATQDSETFHEAHWLKRVRYTDDTKIDNLEIGGRNLLPDTHFYGGVPTGWSNIYGTHTVENHIYKKTITNLDGGARVQFSFDFNEIGTFTFSIYSRINSDLDNLVWQSFTGLTVVSKTEPILKNDWKIYSVTFSATTAGSKSIRAYVSNTEIGSTVEIDWYKLEKGNKATDWTPAPEDVQAEIDSAKQEALAASNNVQTNVNSLNTYVDGAFKDGVISEAEAKSIEKYLNSVDESMAQAEGIYDSVKSNTLLIDKSSLTNTFNALDVAKEALKTAINTAIADGKTTITEKNNVDAKFIIFNEKMKLFQIAIGDAEKAIQVEQKRLSDEKVDELEIGGRNLFTNVILLPNINWDRLSDYEWANNRVTTAISIFDTGNLNLKSQESYTISFEIRTSNSDIQFSNSTLYINSNISTSHSRPELIEDEYIKVFGTFVYQEGTGYVHIYLNGITAVNQLYIRNIKVEKGNKATDWTPAPEDVQSEIDSAKQDASTAQSTANTARNEVGNLNSYMDGAFKDGVIDEAEAKAIEKYKNTINETMAKAEASFLKVFANTYLEGAAKIDLENAKINLWGQRETLRTAINTAIAGGTTTPAQKTAVDNAFTSFNNLMSAFQSALEEANKAIQAKLDAISKGYVDELEIGGRNLALNSNFNTTDNGSITTLNKYTYSDINGVRRYEAVGKDGTTARYIEFNIPNLDVGAYTMTIKCRPENRRVNSIDTSSTANGLTITSIPITDDFVKYTIHFNKIVDSNTPLRLLFYQRRESTTSDEPAGILWIDWYKIEKGNKATDWTPAPEDVQAEIDGIGEYMEGTLEDGVIDKAEAKAIAEHLKTIGDRYVTDDALYYKLIDNPYLKAGSDAKNTLESVMQSQYRRDKPLLDTAINNIVSNGKVTTSLRNAFNTAFTNYTKSTKAFQEAVEEARKAIEEQRVNDIEIGGRNYAVGSKYPHPLNTLSRYSRTLVDGISRYEAQGLDGTQVRYVQINIPNIPMGEYTFSIRGRLENKAFTGSNIAGGEVTSGSLRGILQISDDLHVGKITINKNTNEDTLLEILFYQNRDSTTSSEDASVFWLDWYKLEKGNKATDWTPAPEDVDKKISDADAKAADAQAKANKSAAITDLFSGFNGGLATAVIMEMREPSTTARGDATAGISGIQGAAKDEPAIWAGGTYDQAIGGTAKAIIRHDGTAKFTDAEITGEINATSGSFTGGYIGGMHIAGDTIVSENGRLVIDGTNNTIYLLDDSGAIKTVIRPNDIPTSVSSYFSGSLNQNVSFLGIKGTVFGAATQDSNTIALSGNAYEVTIPPLTLAASSTYTGSGVGSAILTLKLVLSNGGSANDIPVAQVMAISTSVEGYDQVVLPETKKMITKSGTWRLRLISITESVGGGTTSYNGSLTSSATTFNVSEIVNRSEIGSNGMMVATSANNYNFMVGGTFEVRRGNGGLRITNSGIQKWNGSSWVTANI